MNLGEALWVEIDSLGRNPEPKSPVTSDRGLHARMRALEKEHGSAGAAARSMGVSAETWRRWGKSGTNPRTGKPWQRPGTASQNALNRAAAELYRRTFHRSVRGRLREIRWATVTAIVNWDGYYNRQHGGYRTVKLDQLKSKGGPWAQRLYTGWAENDPEQLAGLFEAAVSAVYDGSIVNFEGDDVVARLWR